MLLLGALAFAGVLRALPVLAQREPVPPLRLWRALSALGVAALLVRGALYALGLAEANWSDGFVGAELFIGWPLALLGVGLCALAAFWCVKRPGYKRLGVAVGAALFAPHLLRVLLAPLVAHRADASAFRGAQPGRDARRLGIKPGGAHRGQRAAFGGALADLERSGAVGFGAGRIWAPGAANYRLETRHGFAA